MLRWDGAEWVPYSGLLGGKKLRHLGGVIRGNANGTESAWGFITTYQHSYFGFTGITCTSTYIRVSFAEIGANVISFVAALDEAFASKGFFVGASVGDAFADIYIYKKENAYAYITGSDSDRPDAFVYNTGGHANISAINYDSVTGVITITHPLASDNYIVDLTPRYTMGATRPVIGTWGNTMTMIKILKADGSVRTGAASLSDRFTFMRQLNNNGVILVNPQTLNVINSNIWLFGILED